MVEIPENSFFKSISQGNEISLLTRINKIPLFCFLKVLAHLWNNITFLKGSSRNYHLHCFSTINFYASRSMVSDIWFGISLSIRNCTWKVVSFKVSACFLVRNNKSIVTSKHCNWSAFFMNSKTWLNLKKKKKKKKKKEIS